MINIYQHIMVYIMGGLEVSLVERLWIRMADSKHF